MWDFIENTIQPHFNYWAYVIIMMLGLWALIAKQNLIKKLIGMSIFQTAIILFYVSLGVKEDATIPIVDHHAEAVSHDHHDDPESHDKHDHKAHAKPVADDFDNPLPHVLMLTAIVVGVATLGVALAVAQSIFKDFGTLEEPEILEKIKTGETYD
jgi:multicomponent Na+:H+ antiporter subunit C